MRHIDRPMESPPKWPKLLVVYMYVRAVGGEVGSRDGEELCVTIPLPSMRRSKVLLVREGNEFL